MIFPTNRPNCSYHLVILYGILGALRLLAADPASSTRFAEDSIKIAGPNAGAVQKFVQGDKSPDAATLISLSSPADLVNANLQLLSDDVDYGDKARANVKWSGGIPPEVWNQFVLPLRVADEPLDDYKPDFFAKLAPLVANTHDSGEAALLVHQWYWTANKGGACVDFKISESRDQSPRMILNQTKTGRCFEMNLLCVALLRSVGVPARIAGIPFWMNMEFYHYWVEYYDTKTSSWLYFEGSTPDTDTMLPKTLLKKSDINGVYATVYALPGYCAVPDPIGKERWDLLINTTSLYCPTGTLHLSASTQPGNKPPSFVVYSWNLFAWRSVARATGDSQGQADISIASNDDNYPYLISIANGNHFYWQSVTVGTNSVTELTDLSIAQASDEQIVPVVRPVAGSRRSTGAEE